MSEPQNPLAALDYMGRDGEETTSERISNTSIGVPGSRAIGLPNFNIAPLSDAFTVSAESACPP